MYVIGLLLTTVALVPARKIVIKVKKNVDQSAVKVEEVRK